MKVVIEADDNEIRRIVKVYLTEIAHDHVAGNSAIRRAVQNQVLAVLDEMKWDFTSAVEKAAEEAISEIASRVK